MRIIQVCLDEKLVMLHADVVEPLPVQPGQPERIDYEYERVIRHINSDMAPEITTVFLMPPRDIAEVSSNMIKSLIGPVGWEDIVRRYVPAPVFEMLAREDDKNAKRDLNIMQ